MKILFANKFFYLKGGAEVSFFETAKLLESKGHEVMFFSMQHERNFQSRYAKYFIKNVDYEKEGLCNKVSVAQKLLYSFESKKKINNLIQQKSPNIAHLNNIYHQISPSIIHSLKKNKIPIVMSLRDYKLVCASYSMLSKGAMCERCKNGKYYQCFLQGCAKESKIKSLLNTVEMYLHHKILHIYELVDIFISPSRFLIAKLEDMGFKGKIVYLPNFVKVEEFTPQYEADENSIVYFGRLSKEKGLFTLIEAVEGLDARLKIIGEGPIRKSIEHRAKVKGIRNIEFLGYKSGEDLRNEIRKSMFAVVPSEWYENNPRSVIEAFALGKPVVGARIGGIPELIKDNETGLTFEAGNVKDLWSKIEYLIYNPDKVMGMGRNARAFVEKELNADRHYRELIRIYQIAGKSTNEYN